MTTGNRHELTQDRGWTYTHYDVNDEHKEREEMLAWCPTQDQADALFAWTREKGIAAVCLKRIAAVCLKRIERMEAELDAIKRELGKI